MSENYLEIIKQDKVYPIIRCKEPEQAVEISKALVEGGIRVLEINVENPSLYGASMTPLYCLIIASVLNIFLALLFILEKKDIFIFYWTSHIILNI